MYRKIRELVEWIVLQALVAMIVDSFRQGEVNGNVFYRKKSSCQN